MAWQNSAATGNGAGPSGAGGGGEGASQASQPQGAEYTLQGTEHRVARAIIARASWSADLMGPDESALDE